MIHNAAFFVNSEITIIDAKYVKDYIIEVTFSDGKINIIDFRKAIMRIKNPDFEIYKELYRQYQNDQVRVNNNSHRNYYRDNNIRTPSTNQRLNIKPSDNSFRTNSVPQRTIRTNTAPQRNTSPSAYGGFSRGRR